MQFCELIVAVEMDECFLMIGVRSYMCEDMC